jgi:excisionase family DNA binding protein
MITTTQAAKRLGIGVKTLSRYIAAKKVPAPQIIEFGGFRVHSWSEAHIEEVRNLLPKIANGRKTRFQKQAKKKQKKKAKP